MPLLSVVDAAELLRCPRCRARLTASGEACAEPSCDFSSVGFRRLRDQPVLIDATDSIVDVSSIEPSSDAAPGLARRLLAKLAVGNPVAPRISSRIASDLSSSPEDRRPLVLIVGGGTVGSGLQQLYDDPSLEVLSFDVFPSRVTQFVADAHAIPLADASVDAVVIQAVLEHVLDPARVVAEIHRVLRTNGIVYADTPFLQHVHEGPFDFTRFTESGHRWLFRRFEMIESGVVAGVGTELSWSVAQAIRSLVPVSGVSSAIRLLMTPVAMVIDRFANPQHATDGASSVYFYGRRSELLVQPRDMVTHYRGAQRKPTRLG